MAVAAYLTLADGGLSYLDAYEHVHAAMTNFRQLGWPNATTTEEWWPSELCPWADRFGMVRSLGAGWKPVYVDERIVGVIYDNPFYSR